jgi:DNA-binding NtrC family response regulator
MGVSLAIAIASARSGSTSFEYAHSIAWLIASLVMLDLVLQKQIRPLVRSAVVAGFTFAAFVGSALAHDGLLPPSTFGVVVVSAILATGALHQVLLVGRGHGVEGVLSGIALVSFGVVLAYAWFGPFTGMFATGVEFAVAAMLWLGHLAWLDPGWRSLRRSGVPLVVASVSSFILGYVLVPEAPLERSELAALGLASGILWWGVFSLARKLSNRAVWSTSGRLADAAQAARHNLLGASTLEDIASAALVPLGQALEASEGSPEIYTLEPPLRMRMDLGERATVKSGDAPAAIAKALFVDGLHAVLDLPSLRSRVVREPSVRTLVDSMQAQGIGMVVPCQHLGHIEGLLLLPGSDRGEPAMRIEVEELRRLSETLGGSLAAALAHRRADTRIHQISAERRSAEDRITALQAEVQQLRQQCDVLGRALAEDQTLHVAYSQSMRRVQTRAIELAPLAEPVLLVADAGSPVLPVSRFIHDRGPRWGAPFIVADCSAAPPEQVMRLLFGPESEHCAGWFQSATGGTLLLRDIPALGKQAQARLASFLIEHDAVENEAGQTLEAKPRIIATSRATSKELLRRGALDPDLARCFSGPGLRIPPLRDRREDVPSLALLAIDRACRVLARDPVGIDQAAMVALVDHEWPGDVAELELVIELAVGRTSSKTISVADLPPLAWPGAVRDESLDGTYLEVERRLLEHALSRSGGNKSEAARMLGLKRTTFLDKLRRHNLEQRPHEDLGGSAIG